MEISIRRRHSGRSGFLAEGIVFLLVFFSVFLATFLLPDPIVEQHDEMLSLIALALALAISVLVAYVVERKYGVTQQLLATFGEEQCVLRTGHSEWTIPYQEITSVVKVMAFNRIYNEKGAYRVTIKWKGHSSITFWTTDQEYQEHRDFENTQLYELYLEMKKHGVKCY